uniref:ACYPI004975 protein n=1 Tax=Acyrthosiphon pisum TaxID=7029 RepID=C4WU12_ACYPI|nr:ACYPI004975 [Acyrthosiphon pisum]
MGKVRRYKKKLAKAAEGTTNVSGGNVEQPEQTNYLELAEELMRMKKDDDKMSVCSVMKSVKSCGGGESLKLKKDAKRYLKHAFLIKKLGVTQKKLKRRKKKV